MFKGWRSLAVAGIMAIIGAVQPFASAQGIELPDQTAVQAFIDGVYANYEWLFGLVMVLMRAVTSTPIFKKAAPE